MHKEILIAIILGSAIGLIAAFGIWRANETLTSKPDDTTETQVNKIPNGVALTQNFEVTLAKIEDRDVATTSPYTIEGITLPKTFVAFSGDSKDYVVLSNDKGAFTEQVELSGGLNAVKIAAFYGNDSKEKEVLVAYSSELAPKVDENANIEETVEDRLRKTASLPKLYTGTVTDITGQTIQIRNDKGTIEQISVSDTTSYVKTGKTQADIKFSDLAIGDFVAALGAISSKDLMQATRIIVTQPVNDQRKITKGVVAQKTTKLLTIKTIAGDEMALDLVGQVNLLLVDATGTVKKARSSDLSAGKTVIVMSITSDKTTAARSVFILP